MDDLRASLLSFAVIFVVTHIRKEDNKYKKYVKRGVGGWIAKILIDLVWLLIIFAFPIV